MGILLYQSDAGTSSTQQNKVSPGLKLPWSFACQGQQQREAILFVDILPPLAPLPCDLVLFCFGVVLAQYTVTLQAEVWFGAKESTLLTKERT